VKVGDLVRDTFNPQFDGLCGIVVDCLLGLRPLVLWSTGEVTVEYPNNLEVINEAS